jgi:Ca-activated chloride channel family protein
MFRIEAPEYLYALIILPVLWGLFIWLQLDAKRKRRKWLDENLRRDIVLEYSVVKPYIKMFWFSLAWIFLVFAAANPQMGTEVETVKRKGADIVFALDVSKSMLSEDVKPNRLAKAKQIIVSLIDKLVSDRVGIIAYAGEAYPVLPITTDYSAAKLYLQNADPFVVSSQGTAISDAIDIATTYFDREDADKILVIISDGEDHGGDALQAAREAAAQGIKIITVGVGTDTGGLIPIRKNGQLTGYKTDRNNNRVVTKRNRTLLYRLAKAGNGIYLDGNNTSAAVKKLEEYLKNINRKEFETKKISGYKSRFQWFLAIGMLFFLLYVFTLDRETGWLKKLNLFNEKQDENV